MTGPRVSIVVLSALRLRHTQKCLESVFAWTPRPFEVVVVDMGLSAQIVAWLHGVAHDRPGVHVVFNDANVGTSRGRNQGVAASGGEYVVFLDNDVVVSEGWLDPLVRAVATDPRVGACGAKVVSEAGRVLVAPESLVCREDGGGVSAIGLEMRDTYDPRDPRVDTAQRVPWYPSTCLLVRRDVFDSVCGFDERIFMAEEDKDLCLAIRKQGFEIEYVPDSLVIHARQDPTPEYRRLRDDPAVIRRDIDYFEAKWSCRVTLECHRSYLKKLGLSDRAIRVKQLMDPFTRVTDD